MATNVRVRAFDASGAELANHVMALAAETQMVLTPSEWLGGEDISGAATFAIESDQPVQTLGLRFDDGAFAPVVLSDEPAPSAPSANPVISRGGWVLGTLSPVQNEISPLAITTLFGAGFAPDGFSAATGPADVVAGRLPARLGGVCVEIDGTRAPLFFVAHNQVNLQALDLRAGTASAVVIRGCGTVEESRSAPETVTVSPRRPAWFVLGADPSGANPIAALHGGGPTVAADPADVPGATPAAPGEAVSLFATGLGQTDPPLNPGIIPETALPGGLARVTAPSSVRIGGRTLPPADVLYVGAAPCCAGLYQVVVRLRGDLADGQHPVEIAVDGFTSPPGPYLTVRRP